MAQIVRDRARVNTATAGTGTMTLGAAVSDLFCTFAEAGVANGETVFYLIEDGTNFEIGTGVYTTAGTTLTRATVHLSKIAGVAGTTKITLSGAAIVSIVASATFLNAKADLDSPTFTTAANAPTPTLGDNDTSIATTAFVQAAKLTVVALTDGATPALDASAGNFFTLAAAGDRTIGVPSGSPVNGQRLIIRHLASGGARLLALNTGAGGFNFGTDITGLTSTPSGQYDYIGCIYNATLSLWDVVAYVKGHS